jgi:hypothetical protein
VTPDSLDKLWQDIVKRTEEKGHEEFSGPVLVAVWELGQTYAEWVKDNFKMFTEEWDRYMDRNFVPAETFEFTMTQKHGLVPMEQSDLGAHDRVYMEPR